MLKSITRPPKPEPETHERISDYLTNMMFIVALYRKRQLSNAPTQVSVQLDRCLDVMNPLHCPHVSHEQIYRLQTATADRQLSTN